MHDRNGTLLKVGDRVMIPGVITELSATENYCNCTVKSEAGRRPDNLKETMSAINTGVVVLVERPQPAA